MEPLFRLSILLALSFSTGSVQTCDLKNLLPFNDPNVQPLGLNADMTVSELIRAPPLTYMAAMTPHPEGFMHLLTVILYICEIKICKIIYESVNVKHILFVE